MKFSSISNTSVSQVPQSPISKLMHSYSEPPVFQRTPQLSEQDIKYGKQSVNYNPSPSALTAETHRLIRL